MGKAKQKRFYITGAAQVSMSRRISAESLQGAVRIAEAIDVQDLKLADVTFRQLRITSIIEAPPEGDKSGAAPAAKKRARKKSVRRSAPSSPPRGDGKARVCATRGCSNEVPKVRGGRRYCLKCRPSRATHTPKESEAPDDPAREFTCATCGKKFNVKPGKVCRCPKCGEPVNPAS